MAIGNPGPDNVCAKLGHPNSQLTTLTHTYHPPDTGAQAAPFLQGLLAVQGLSGSGGLRKLKWDYHQKHHRWPAGDRPVYELQNNRLIKSFSPPHKRPTQSNPLLASFWPLAISPPPWPHWAIFVTLARGHYCLTGFGWIIINGVTCVKKNSNGLQICSQPHSGRHPHPHLAAISNKFLIIL